MTTQPLIRENSEMKYQVLLNGQILTETLTPFAAEQFVSALLPEQRALAKIIPVTSEGKQVLFG